MTHDADVPYQKELLRGVTLPEGWECGQGSDESWWARGPCPTCFGDAYGPALPRVAPKGLRKTASQRKPPAYGALTPEVLVDCRCGFPHGEDGQSGCGRSWVVSCHKAES